MKKEKTIYAALISSLLLFTLTLTANANGSSKAKILSLYTSDISLVDYPTYDSAMNAGNRYYTKWQYQKSLDAYTEAENKSKTTDEKAQAMLGMGKATCSIPFAGTNLIEKEKFILAQQEKGAAIFFNVAEMKAISPDSQSNALLHMAKYAPKVNYIDGQFVSATTFYSSALAIPGISGNLRTEILLSRGSVRDYNAIADGDFATDEMKQEAMIKLVSKTSDKVQRAAAYERISNLKSIGFERRKYGLQNGADNYGYARDYAKGRILLERLIKEEEATATDKANALAHIGELYILDKKIDSARLTFDKSWKIKELSADQQLTYRSEIANIYYKFKMLDDAILQLKAVEKLKGISSDKKTKNYYNLASAFKEKNLLKDAQEMWNKVISLTVSFDYSMFKTAAIRLLGDSYLQNAGLDEGIKVFTNYIKKEKDDFWKSMAEYYVAKSYENKKQDKEAEQHYLHAAKYEDGHTYFRAKAAAELIESSDQHHEYELVAQMISDAIPIMARDLDSKKYISEDAKEHNALKKKFYKRAFAIAEKYLKTDSTKADGIKIYKAFADKEFMVPEPDYKFAVEKMKLLSND